MDNYNLKHVFDQLAENNIFINLDNSYFNTSSTKTKFTKKNYVGCIESIEQSFDETIESLREEGSATVNYRYYPCAKPYYTKNIPVLLETIFKSFNYDPVLTQNKKDISIELVITIENLTKDFIDSCELLHIIPDDEDEMSGSIGEEEENVEGEEGDDNEEGDEEDERNGEEEDKEEEEEGDDNEEEEEEDDNEEEEDDNEEEEEGEENVEGEEDEGEENVEENVEGDEDEDDEEEIEEPIEE